MFDTSWYLREEVAEEVERPLDPKNGINPPPPGARGEEEGDAWIRLGDTPKVPREPYRDAPPGGLISPYRLPPCMLSGLDADSDEEPREDKRDSFQLCMVGVRRAAMDELVPIGGGRGMVASDWDRLRLGSWPYVGRPRDKDGSTKRSSTPPEGKAVPVSSKGSDSSSSKVDGNALSRIADENWVWDCAEKEELRMGTGWGVPPVPAGAPGAAAPPPLELLLPALVRPLLAPSWDDRYVVRGLPLPTPNGIKCMFEGDEKRLVAWSPLRGGWLAALSLSDGTPAPPLPLFKPLLSFPFPFVWLTGLARNLFLRSSSEILFAVSEGKRDIGMVVYLFLAAI